MIFEVEEYSSQSNSCLEITAFPKKISDQITIEIHADSEDHCIVVLSNQVGRILRMRGARVNKGKNKIQMDNVRSLESGLYQLSVKNKQSIILYTSILTKF